jgi:hypothetical protein
MRFGEGTGFDPSVPSRYALGPVGPRGRKVEADAEKIPEFKPDLHSATSFPDGESHGSPPKFRLSISIGRAPSIVSQNGFRSTGKLGYAVGPRGAPSMVAGATRLVSGQGHGIRSTASIGAFSKFRPRYPSRTRPSARPGGARDGRPWAKA